MLNPSEISDILKQQLDDINSKVKFEEVGTVLEVGDGVAHVYGLENVRSNELVEFENGVKGVALNLEESNVGVILLNNVNKVTEYMSVRRTGEIASIPVGEGLLGRVINMLGEPIDGKGPIEGKLIDLPLERKAPGLLNAFFLCCFFLLTAIGTLLLRGDKAEQWIEKKGHSRRGTFILATLFFWSFISLSQVSVFLYFNF